MLPCRRNNIHSLSWSRTIQISPTSLCKLQWPWSLIEWNSKFNMKHINKLILCTGLIEQRVWAYARQTAWKVSAFGVFLVRIFSHSDRIAPNMDIFHPVTGSCNRSILMAHLNRSINNHIRRPRLRKYLHLIGAFVSLS